MTSFAASEARNFWTRWLSSDSMWLYSGVWAAIFLDLRHLSSFVEFLLRLDTIAHFVEDLKVCFSSLIAWASAVLRSLICPTCWLRNIGNPDRSDSWLSHWVTHSPADGPWSAEHFQLCWCSKAVTDRWHAYAQLYTVKFSAVCINMLHYYPLYII